MIRIDSRHARAVIARTKDAATLMPFLRRVDITPEQQDLFRRRGVDGRSGVAARTAQRREKRQGYYRRQPGPGSNARGPYGHWSGDTMERTTGRGLGSTRFGRNTAVIEHEPPRRITNYWNVKGLARYLEQTGCKHLQDVIDGKPMPRVIIGRVGQR